MTNCGGKKLMRKQEELEARQGMLMGVIGLKISQLKATSLRMEKIILDLSPFDEHEVKKLKKHDLIRQGKVMEVRKCGR